MTQITSIQDCRNKLPKGIVLLYGALGEENADQIYSLTTNDELVRKFTGMDYFELAESMEVESFIPESDTVVDGFCLTHRKRVSVDLSTMPGIAVFVGHVVTASESVFDPFVDFEAEENDEDDNGFNFLKTARVACCVETGQTVDVAVERDLDSAFCYVATIDGEVIRVNEFGYTRHGEARLEPVSAQGDYTPPTEQYVAQEGTLHLSKTEAPVFISKYLESMAGPTEPTKNVRLKAYTIHHKDDGVQGITIDLA